ncbi:response regulator [Marinivivus vitaminiproducens]|uniref:response regulator n=1 Tax=Marinivivus vitaminiproducens TaxID=3035935 RepID=UPI0027A292BE|nr:response regulator [Geminicoccaceae bacterium SCSIO 64248]
MRLPDAPLRLKSILGVLIGFLGFCLAAATSVHLVQAYEAARSAQVFAHSDTLRRQLFEAIEFLAEERAWVFLHLNRPSALSDADRERIAALRREVDDRLARAVEQADAYGGSAVLPVEHVAQLHRQRAILGRLRLTSDGDLAQEGRQANPVLGWAWFDRISVVSDRIHAIRLAMLRSLPNTDRSVNDLLTLRNVTWLQTNFAARQAGLLAGIVARGQPIEDDDFEKLAAWNSGFGVIGQSVDSLIARPPASAFAQQFADARYQFSVDFDGPRSQLIEAGRSDEAAAYGIDARQWLDRAFRSIASLVAIQHDIADRSATITAGLQRHANQILVMWLTLCTVGLAAAVGSFVLIWLRVLRPINALTEAMTGLAEGDLRVTLPRREGVAEIDAMRGALLTFKTNEIEREALRRKTLEIEQAAAAAVREQEAQLRSIVENVADGIITVTPSGIIETVNPAALRLFGRSSDELVGRHLRMTIVEERWPRLDDLLARYHATGALAPEDHVRESIGARADGTTFPLEALWTEAGQGDTGKLVIVLRDINERKEVERLKSEFISTVSHELRTPLTSIRGALGLLAGPAGAGLAAQSRQLIEIARRNAERLIALVNDILDIERIESGRLDMSLQPAALRPMIDEAIGANGGYAREHGVTIRLATSVPDVTVMVDSNRILQVMANLLSNAAKFAPKDSVIEVGVESVRDSVAITVHDSGPGIPEAFQSRIFGRFAQADSGDARARGGTGLGLNITRALVERHGGTIGFESRPGSTTFTFTLPTTAPSEPAAEPAAKRSGSVLVCEDDSDVAFLLRTMLSDLGYDVEVASTVKAAREILSRRSFHVLTLDLHLPDESGLALLRWIRGRPDIASLPVVIVSASRLHGDEAAEAVEVAKGVVDWLDKPVDAMRLGRALAVVAAKLGTERPRVLHVEDDADIADLVRRLLGDSTEVVSARSLAEARSLLLREVFDLLLLDAKLDEENGLDLLADLQSLSRPPAVLVFAAQEQDASVVAAVDKVLVKARTSNEQLLNQVLEVASRRRASAVLAATSDERP